jgi:uncharacterized membrane protein
MVSTADQWMQRGRRKSVCTHFRPADRIVFYLYMFGPAALLTFDPLSRGLRVGAILYAALGVLFSLYFMVVQLAFIRAFCIYCLVSSVTTVLLAVVARSHLKATYHQSIPDGICAHGSETQ